MTAIRRLALAALVVDVLCQRIATADEPVPRQPLFRIVDLDRGESQLVELADGTRAHQAARRGGGAGQACARPSARPVSQSRSTARSTTLISANYRLPITVGGVQIDCPVTRGYYKNCDPFEDSWGLDKDARLRLWPEGSPWAAPGTFVYPDQAALVRRRDADGQRALVRRRRRRPDRPRRSTTIPGWTSGAARAWWRWSRRATGSSSRRAGRRCPSIPTSPSTSAATTTTSTSSTTRGGSTATRT